MTLQEQVKRKIALCPVDGAELTIAWGSVWNRIERHATKRRPKLKSFEVHHLTQRAREAIFEAFVHGEKDLENKALAAIGLNVAT